MDISTGALRSQRPRIIMYFMNNTLEMWSLVSQTTKTLQQAMQRLMPFKWYFTCSDQL